MKHWRLTITLLPERYAVCRMESADEVPSWALRASFSAIVRTPEELCVICPERDAPARVKIRIGGWRAMRLEGTVDHVAESGVLQTVAEPLARAGISIFPVTSAASGYVLVREEKVEAAVRTLTEWGHTVRPATAG